MILYFIIVLLIVGTIFEMALHRRQVKFLELQRDNASDFAEVQAVEVHIADQLIADLFNEQVSLIAQRDAARHVADAAEQQTRRYAAELHKVAVSNRNLEQSVLLLSNELDEQQVAYAKRVLGGDTVATSDGVTYSTLPLDEV